MKWMEITVALEDFKAGPAVELIAEVFTDFGAQGVVIEDPNEKPTEEWAPEAERRPRHWAVIGYLPCNHRLDERLQNLLLRLETIQKQEDITCRTGQRQIDEEDWAESWKAFFWPEKIGRRLVVKPTWREYRPQKKDEIILQIDPSMAFGTGTHATTAMCVAMIESWLRPGQRLLDIGTGSGILMIAAALLGADHVTGVDNDEVATAVALENLRLNRISPEKYKVVTGSLAEQVSGAFDVVVANILTPVIVQLVPDIRRLLAEGGLFICSGIIEESRAQVSAALQAHRLKQVDIRQREGWVALAACAAP